MRNADLWQLAANAEDTEHEDADTLEDAAAPPDLPHEGPDVPAADDWDDDPALMGADLCAERADMDAEPIDWDALEEYAG